MNYHDANYQWLSCLNLCKYRYTAIHIKKKMPIDIHLKRGNTAAITAYTGPAGEVVIDTETKHLHIQDNATVGGIKVANVADIRTDVVYLSGDQTINGTKTFTSTINGTALKANWADLAEKYISDHPYSSGTLVMFGGEKEITIATDHADAVVSTAPGILINGDSDGVAIALAGRVPIRIKGIVNKMDKIVVDPTTPGVGKVDNQALDYIARALESSNNKYEKLILCVTRFTI